MMNYLRIFILIHFNLLFSIFCILVKISYPFYIKGIPSVTETIRYYRDLREIPVTIRFIFVHKHTHIHSHLSPLSRHTPSPAPRHTTLNRSFLRIRVLVSKYIYLFTKFLFIFMNLFDLFYITILYCVYYIIFRNESN